MSLINEALKQAQREAQGKDAPAVRDAHVADAIKGGTGRSPLVPVALTLLLAAAGGAAYFWWSGSAEPEVPVVAKVPPKPSTAKSESVAPAPVVPPAEATSLEPNPSTKPDAATPVVAPPGPTDAGELKPKVPVVDPVAPPVEPAPVAPVVPAEPPPPVENTQVTALVNSMRVAIAVRSTGRAKINDKVVSVGGRVIEYPVVTLVEITDRELVFKDAAGFVYRKSYK